MPGLKRKMAALLLPNQSRRVVAFSPLRTASLLSESGYLPLLTCTAVHFGVFLADAVVTGGAVLEVVAVLFGLDVLPSGGHLGGGDGELVLAFEPAAVVGVVNLQDIPLELIRHVCYHGNFASGLGMVFLQCRRGQDGTKIKKALGSVRKLYLPLNAF